MLNNSNANEKWPPNTILITGDSMINQMDEKRFSYSVNRNVKVRSFLRSRYRSNVFLYCPSP